MQVYISSDRPLASLSKVEKAEMLEGANRNTKTTKGKLASQMSNSQMPAFSQEQIVELFREVEKVGQEERRTGGAKRRPYTTTAQ